MHYNTEELYRRAKRVVETDNGRDFPRHAQLEAMKQLQEFIKAVEAQVSPKGP